MKKVVLFCFFGFISIIVFASFPMWSLAILGNFGGFDIDDLAPFSTASIRFKGFLIAISMTSVVYVIYTFSNLSIVLQAK